MKRLLVWGLVLSLFACDVHYIDALAEGFMQMIPEAFRYREFVISNTTPFSLHIKYKEYDPKIKSSLWATDSLWKAPKKFKRTIGGGKQEVFFKVAKGGGIGRGQEYIMDFNCVLDMSPQYSFTLRYQTKGKLVGSEFTLTFISPTGEKKILCANSILRSKHIIPLDNNTRLIMETNGRIYDVDRLQVISFSLQKMAPIKKPTKPTHAWQNQ